MKIGLHRITRASLSALVLAIVAALLATVPFAAPTAGPLASTAAAAEVGSDEAAGYGRMMLVLDSSGSMAESAGGGQTKIAAAKSALQTVIGGLPEDAEVGLRVFGATVFSRNDKGACTDSQAVVPPGTDNRAELSAAVEKYKPYGETPIPHALEEAAKDLGGEGARSIVLVSDGESTCAPDPCQVAEQLHKDGIELRIDVVGLSVSGAARDQLRCIAERGNGNYYDAEDAKDIESRLTRVAERAIRPFVITGEPISGGPADSPTPITIGEWVDEIDPRGASLSYAFERTTPGTTLRVTSFIQGEASYSDGLTIEITGPDGSRCDLEMVTRNFDTREIIGIQATAGDTAGDGTTDGCAAPGTYVISVTRSSAATETVPLGLRVTEEPPVTDPGFTDPSGGEIDATAPQPAGNPTPVDGGSSFVNAAEIGAGSWSSTVVPGEALMYRFPVEFGQAVRLSVSFPEAKGGVAEAFWRFPPLAHIAAYSPMQAQIPFPQGATPSGNPDATTLSTALPAVSRTQTTGTGEFDGGADLQTSGFYYLGVSVQRKDYTVEIPFTITVELDGEPAEGPTYADGATWTVADGLTEGVAPESASPSPTESGGQEAAEPAGEEDDSSSMLLVVGGIGVLVLIAAAALLVWRRRQAGSQTTG